MNRRRMPTVVRKVACVGRALQSTSHCPPAALVGRRSELDAHRRRHAEPERDFVVKTHAAGLDEQPLAA